MKSVFCLLTSVLGLTASAQTVYIPNGTSGIGSSSNGNVGIGTASPSAKLDVRGEVWVGGSSSPVLRLRDGSSEYATMRILEGDFAFEVNNAERMRVSSSGNVGIGTTSPGARLDVLGYSKLVTNSGYYGTRIGSVAGGDSYVWLGSRANVPVIQASNEAFSSHLPLALQVEGGNVGIGTTSPSAKFEIASDYSGESSAFRITANDPTPYNLTIVPYVIGAANVGYKFQTQNASATTTTMVLAGNGRVGIGTSSPSHELSVNGTIRAMEIIVDTGWADYVFADDYRLAPLTEVEAHIKEHRHLPGIPSAAEVTEHGVSLGEMQTRMMAKIEELTLHQIHQEKRMARLEAENSNLRAKLSALSEP